MGKPARRKDAQSVKKIKKSEDVDNSQVKCSVNAALDPEKADKLEHSLPPGLSSETVERALTALLKWREAKSKMEKPQLLEQDEFLYLILTLKKIPSKGRTNPFKIPVPHALINPQVSEVCLIIDDRPGSNLTKAAAQEKIKAENIQVSKVMKLSKLRTDYKPFEAKRKLCASYEMFLADKRVMPVLPKLLGKQFFKKKKIPVGVNLTHKNWKEQIERVYGSALLFLSTGTCSVVKVARISMGKKEMLENVVAAINGTSEVVPRKWRNVRSFHVKMLESLALPIYQTVPDFKLKIEGIKNKEEEELKDEEVKGEARNEASAVKKKAPKKGRIHEVRYMDTELDDLMDDEDDDDDDSGIDEIDEEGEDNEMVPVGKKRKKGETRKEVVELSRDKKMKKSAKLKKESSPAKEKKSALKKSDTVKKEGSLIARGEDLNGKKEKEKKKTKKNKL